MRSWAVLATALLVAACAPERAEQSGDGGKHGRDMRGGAPGDGGDLGRIAGDLAPGGGGGGGRGPTPDYVSGTRIKARIQTSGDGAAAMIGWYDSTLKVNCAFARAADDVERCLPSDAAPIDTTHWGDSNCNAVPLVVSAPPCGPAAYAVQSEQTMICSSAAGPRDTQRTHVFALGTAYTGTMMWEGVPGSCMPLTGGPYPNTYQLGGEMAAATFAAGEIQIVP